MTAQATLSVLKRLLLGLFAAFLVFAGAILLICEARPHLVRRVSRTLEFWVLGGYVFYWALVLPFLCWARGHPPVTPTLTRTLFLRNRLQAQGLCRQRISSICRPRVSKHPARRPPARAMQQVDLSHRCWSFHSS